MTHVIIPGEIQAVIGPDGFAEAIERRWLVPDTDSGYLCATNDLDVLGKMRKLAEMKSEEYTPEAIPVAESHDLAILHTHRQHQIVEIAAPMTGGQSPGLSTVAQPQEPQQPQQQPPQGGGGGYAVGTPVTVARQGVKATGVIEKLMLDGRYTVGYPTGVAQRPPGDNVFSKEEMSVVPTEPQRTTSQSPSPSSF